MKEIASERPKKFQRAARAEILSVETPALKF